ncbi:hypothetical protein AURDEDRAFT_187863, partial [Auricularia subglabra TFB-10046 SS5]
MAATEADAGPSRLPAADERPQARGATNENENESGRMDVDVGDGAHDDDDEPLDDGAIDDIYRRVGELGGGGKKTAATSEMTERESEFAQLILRLCEHAKLLSGQVGAQAEYIGHLRDQQAFLVERQKEDQLRFDVERRAWQRTAEVLVLQARKAGNNDRRIDDLEQALAMAKSNNKQWETRCMIAEHTLSLLDGQVVNLAPAITFQPDVMLEGAKQLWYDNQRPIPTAPNPNPNAAPAAAANGKPKQIAGTKRKASDPPPPPQPPLPPPRPIAIYQPPVTQPHPGPGTTRKAPLSADARTEHLLLASRTLSKQRAALARATGKFIAQYPQPMHNTWYIPYRGQHQQAIPLVPIPQAPPPLPIAGPSREREPAQKEKEKENDKDKGKGKEPPAQKEPPRTPARKRLPAPPPPPPPVTPKVHTPAPPPGSQQRTPLDSLVSAARLLEQESPSRPSPSKRRRLSGQAMSALDVLAAQAVGSSDEDEDELLESEEDAPPLRSSLPTLREEEEDE